MVWFLLAFCIVFCLFLSSRFFVASALNEVRRNLKLASWGFYRWVSWLFLWNLMTDRQGTLKGCPCIMVALLRPFHILMHPLRRSQQDSCNLTTIWSKEPCIKDFHNMNMLNHFAWGWSYTIQNLQVSDVLENQPWYFQVWDHDISYYNYAVPRRWLEFLRNTIWLNPQ